jgi:hypothetical protein
MMASAAIEQRMMGHMTHPPALISSNMFDSCLLSTALVPAPPCARGLHTSCAAKKRG